MSLKMLMSDAVSPRTCSPKRVSESYCLQMKYRNHLEPTTQTKGSVGMSGWPPRSAKTTSSAKRVR